jgi:gluconate 2-dehydrogenase gamma chain
VGLTPGQQTEVLTEVERTSTAFFNLILEHTRHGFYGDPRHGGNRNRISWKMLRLPFPPLRGRQIPEPDRTA